MRSDEDLRKHRKFTYRGYEGNYEELLRIAKDDFKKLAHRPFCKNKNLLLIKLKFI